MPNPILAEVTRGGIVESIHRGAVAVIGPQGRIVAEAGEIDRAVFPRSAIKAFQALPLVEGGAADRYGFTDEEISLACASHGGEPVHVEAARRMLAKAAIPETLLECGAHPPSDPEAARELACRSLAPLAVHNNCSGKHAGMLAVAVHSGVAQQEYSTAAHPARQRPRMTLIGAPMSSASPSPMSSVRNVTSTSGQILPSTESRRPSVSAPAGEPT